MNVKGREKRVNQKWKKGKMGNKKKRKKTKEEKQCFIHMGLLCPCGCLCEDTIY